jgi:dipeptidyl-peptidase-4
MKNRLIAVLLILISFVSIYPQPKNLTVKDIYSNRLFYGKYLQGAKWCGDGSKYSFLKYDANAGGLSIFQHDIAQNEESVLASAEDLKINGEKIDFSNYMWSPDSKYILFTGILRARKLKSGGSFYLYDVATKKVTLVSESQEEEKNVMFSPDSKKIGFVKGNNIFYYDIASGKTVQLTFDGSENIINGAFDWVYEEEFDLITGWEWAPDSKSIAFWQLDQSVEPLMKIAKYDSLHLNFLEYRYPKPGDHNALVKVGVAALDNPGVKWMDIGTEKDIYIPRIKFTSNSGVLSIQRLNRLQNKLELLLADTKTGKSNVVYTETDQAWIDITNNLYFYKSKSQFIISSEKDGYTHLYLYDLNGRLINQVTKGKFEVKDLVKVDEANDLIYFTSNKRDVMYMDLFSVKSDGSGLEMLTKSVGYHSCDLSSNYKYYLDLVSTASTPAVTSVASTDGKFTQEIIKPDLSFRESYNFSPVEYLKFKTEDGVELNACMIKPHNFDKNKKYPVLMANYSGPGSQLVVDRYGSVEFIWYQMLAEKGYVIFYLDNRGTGGRGSEFKKMVYKQLGKYEVQDMIEGAKYLGSLPFVDKDRIGIWGWSYGGYVSAFTILKGSKYFKAAVAVAPVTHWKFYDTIYAERYMQTPSLNPQGYEDSSPLNYAEDLKGKLLVIHGTADDNVHFQNSVELVNRLVDNNKPVEVMYYPEKDHGIYGGLTRIHLFEKITNFILNNL